VLSSSAAVRELHHCFATATYHELDVGQVSCMLKKTCHAGQLLSVGNLAYKLADSFGVLSVLQCQGFIRMVP
jgi:hypothetical protein